MFEHRNEKGGVKPLRGQFRECFLDSAFIKSELFK